jgi:hypothetical protein
MPRFNQMLAVQVVLFADVQVLLLKYALALDRSRTERLIW